LTNGSWEEITPPIHLQSEDFVKKAFVRTGKNYSISCHSNECRVSNEKRLIYGKVDDMFAPIQLRPSFQIFTTKDACHCLKKHSVILGFGDSLMRRVMASWMTDTPFVNTYVKETRIPDNTTVLEQSTLFPCEDVGAQTQVMKLTAWLFGHLHSKVIPTLDILHSKGTKTDIILVGFGIHNVHLTEAELRGQIMETVFALDQHPATSSATKLWILPHQSVPSRFPPPRNVTDAGKNALIRRFNDLVIELVPKCSWWVLDFYDLSKGKANYTSDGIHFTPEIFRWKNQAVMNVLCGSRLGWL